MATRKRSYLREDYINFRPSPQAMRELEEMWNAWGETRTDVVLRSIHTMYLLWKNGWIIDRREGSKAEYQPLRIKEE